MRQRFVKKADLFTVLPTIGLIVVSLLAVTGCDEAGMMKPVVPVDNGTDPVEPTDPTTNGEVKQPEEPIEPIEPEPEPTEPVEPESTEPVEPEPVEPEPEPIVTVTLPPGYALPPELIPATLPTLSADEAALIEADKWVKQNHPDFDVTAPKLRTQAGHTADLISLLPHKEREEVYELFVASVDLPSFTQAAERMWEINVRLRVLNGEGERTGNKGAYWKYLDTVSTERGFRGSNDLNRLADIYFEENPQDAPYQHEGISYYWIILEYYRLQLENPNLPNLYQKNNPTELLKLFRQSCQNGYVFGLDNPLD